METVDSGIIIYHNGECSKSRGALELLQELNIPHDVRWFVTDPLSKEEMKVLLQKLGMSASELVRKNELYFKEHLSEGTFTDDEWIDIMLAHPELIERPVVACGEKALVARPAERIHELL